MLISLDSETYYKKDEYSVVDLGNYAYCHDPRFNCYLVSAFIDDCEPVALPPEEFPWEEVDGADIVGANFGFDQAVIDRMIELKIIPPVKFGKIYDVLDLARYLGYPGNLASASEHLLSKTMDKGVRSRANGLQWADMDPDFRAEMIRYAKTDVVYPMEIWKAHGHRWPQWEQEIAQFTREMCARGVPVDADTIDAKILDLEKLLAKVRAQIPWTVNADGTDNPDAKALSKKEVALECKKCDLTPPRSMAKDSDEFDEWLRVNGDKAQWAKAMGRYRSINTFYLKLKGMQIRTKPDRIWMPYSLKYCAAHTLRDGGDGGVNMQNLQKEPFFAEELKEYLGLDYGGIDMRKMLMAPDGYEFGVIDLTAIEPRTLAVFAEDWDFVDMLHQGYDPYEAWARSAYGYNDSRPLKEVDSQLRGKCKIEVLMLGYGAGWEKMQSKARREHGIILTDEEAMSIVFNFRKRKFIPNLWKSLESKMFRAAPEDFQIELPSGRFQTYRAVKTFGGVTAVIPRKGRMMRLKFWGGTIVENVVQATARDIFMTGALNIQKELDAPILRVHDEVVMLFKKKTAKAQLEEGIKIMSRQPSWMPDVPLAADGYLCKNYEKH